MPTQSGTTHSTLASPVRIGATELPNRVALAPMTRVSATAEGYATDRMASTGKGFRKRRAGMRRKNRATGAEDTRTVAPTTHGGCRS
jgi:2,4-dienoyl-CoA reductase-like NADH-dependent reductase (Old Yellow Enzyme family)